jgi:hypothetical protein
LKTVKFLKIALALIGVAIIVLGLNIGLGGIKTLGWQMPRDFISITDTVTFGAQDSHIRFMGGVWFGIGVLFFVGSFAFKKLRPTLISLCLIIPVAGLFRLSAMDANSIFSASIAPSFVLELIGFPILALWIKRTPINF